MPTIARSSTAAPLRLTADPGAAPGVGPARRHRLCPDAYPGWLAGAVVLLVPGLAFTGLVLYQLYVKGSFLLDTGWFAYVMSAHDLRLSNPRSLGGASFFSVHVSPVLFATELIRRGLPVSDGQFFAGFIGLAHALPALATYWALRAGLLPCGGVATAVAAGLGIAFSFNGLALAIARYPHIEMLIVGSVMLFAVALAQRRLALAGLCFALALATREDAGLHLFALLSMLIALNRRRAVPWRAQRAELAFAMAALAYSLAAVAVQHILPIAGGPPAFLRIYLGDPPFAGLTAAIVLERLLGWLAYRTYLVLPALVAVLWAVRTGNPYLLVGYLAFLPWALLHLVAHSEIAGTLSGYYAFPFMIASFWPLVGVMFGRRHLAPGGADGSSAMLPLVAFAAMIIASFAAIGWQYNPGRYDLTTALLEVPSAARQQRTELAVAALVRSKPQLGTVVIDGSVVALAPDDFAWSETVFGRGEAQPDTVVYFAHGYEAGKARALAKAAGLEQHYRIAGTSIRVAADRPIPTAAPIAALLAAIDDAD